MQIQRYGWVHDLPDHRDYRYAPTIVAPQELPPFIDLTDRCPPVVDQGNLGSCTANAIGAAFHFEELKQQTPDADIILPSRLFIYYNERVMENTVESDAGAQIRDGIKSLATLGVCDEVLWGYDISAFAVKPDSLAYSAALKSTITTYQRIPQDLHSMKSCLAEGYPFVFGFTVYDNFETIGPQAQLDMPTPQNVVLGGHAVMAVGYDDAVQRFIVRNSWGTSWGLNGYFTMPYAYLTDQYLADDFWTIRTVT